MFLFFFFISNVHRPRTCFWTKIKIVAFNVTEFRKFKQEVIQASGFERFSGGNVDGEKGEEEVKGI